LLASAGTLAHHIGDLDASEQALAIARAAGDLSVPARALNNLAQDAAYRGDVERCEELEAEAIAIYRALGQPASGRMALSNLAWRAWNDGDDATCSRTG
jgi:hypothetical protein